MLRPRKTADAARISLKLIELQAALQREAVNAESDPFDDALVAAVAGLVETMKVEGAAMEEARKRIVRLARA